MIYMAKRPDPAQASLWDDGLPYRGRPSARPWGVPLSAWATYLRESKRGTKPDLRDLVTRRCRRPIWVAPADWSAKERPETAPRRHASAERYEVIVFRESTTTSTTRSMIERGLFPGVQWIPGKGGVRMERKK